MESGTGLRCYDVVPLNAESPFYYAEVIGKRPEPSKTMFKDRFTVSIHCVAAKAENDSSVGVYDLIQQLEEALTVDIQLSADYELVAQVNNGINTIKTDETGEKHAVLEWDFVVCYGFKCK